MDSYTTGRNTHLTSGWFLHLCWIAWVLKCLSAELLECWVAWVLSCLSAELLECWVAWVLSCLSAGLLECWVAWVLNCLSAQLLECSVAGSFIAWILSCLHVGRHPTVKKHKATCENCLKPFFSHIDGSQIKKSSWLVNEMCREWPNLSFKQLKLDLEIENWLKAAKIEIWGDALLPLLWVEISKLKTFHGDSLHLGGRVLEILHLDAKTEPWR